MKMNIPIDVLEELRDVFIPMDRDAVNRYIHIQSFLLKKPVDIIRQEKILAVNEMEAIVNRRIFELITNEDESSN